MSLRTYLVVSPPLTKSVNLWTLCCVTHSLQDGCFSCISPSNNKDTELNFWDLDMNLLRSHSTRVL